MPSRARRARAAAIRCGESRSWARVRLASVVHSAPGMRTSIATPRSSALYSRTSLRSSALGGGAGSATVVGSEPQPAKESSNPATTIGRRCLTTRRGDPAGFVLTPAELNREPWTSDEYGGPGSPGARLALPTEACGRRRLMLSRLVGGGSCQEAQGTLVQLRSEPRSREDQR